MYNFDWSLNTLSYRMVDSCEQISAYHDYCIWGQILYVYQSSIITMPKNNAIIEKHSYYMYEVWLCSIVTNHWPMYYIER